MAKREVITAADVRKVLRTHYAAPEWCLVEEFRNSTGFARKRAGYADAIAFNCYPSRGLSIIGMEIKVSRSDWKCELSKPEKAEAFFKHLDQWYVVVGSADLIAPGELPTGWGLMCAAGGKLKTLKEAEHRRGEPMDRAMIASLMRNLMSGYVTADSIEARIEDARAAGVITGKSEIEMRLDELRRSVEYFEKASGVTISEGWRYGNVGPAVKQLQAILQWGTRPSESFRKGIRDIVSAAAQIEQMAKVFDEEFDRLAQREPAPESALPDLVGGAA